MAERTAFEHQNRQQQAEAARPAPVSGLPESTSGQQACPGGLLRPRDPRIGRYIKLLDALTAGDEALRDYLEADRPRAVRAVAGAREDMALAETPQEAEELRPDPVDELLTSPVPPAGTPDFSALRAALLAECQDAVADLVMPRKQTAPQTDQDAALLGDLAQGFARLDVPPVPDLLLAECSIPGCCIHSVTPSGGAILHHYTPGELNTPALRLADQLLHRADAPDYVEVYGGVRVVAVDRGGQPREYTV